MIVLPLSRSGPETGRLFLSAQNWLVGIMLLHVWAAGAFHGFWSFCDNDGQWKESVVSVCARFRTALRTEQWSTQVWRLALDQLVLPVASRVVFSVALPSCVAFVLCQVYGPRDGTIQDEHVQHYLVNWFPSFQWSDAFVFFLACFRAIVVLMLIVAIMTCLYRPLKSWALRQTIRIPGAVGLVLTINILCSFADPIHQMFLWCRLTISMDFAI